MTGTAAEPKRIFVAGAASFVGRRLLAQCDAAGIAVSGVDLKPTGRPDCHVADIRDQRIADLIPEGVDAVVNLAALARDSECRGRARACFEVNVIGNLALMDAAAARGARQFVFASSEWVYDSFPMDAPRKETDAIDPARLSSEYALSKLVSEANLRQRHAQGFCPATVLRFGILYGPHRDNWSAVDTLVHEVATKDAVTIGSRATARRFIHVEDVAGAVLAVLGVPGFEVFNIQGPRLVSLGEVIDTAAGLLGRRPRVIERDPDNPSIRPVSDDKARARLGWSARIDLGMGVKTVVDYLELAPSR
ncbi:MAG: NAD-dependent epimerase/dehydratase family protein [Pseudomonadota bacterium]